MALAPYEEQQIETKIKGIPLKNIIIVGGTLILSTLIIWIVRK